MGHNLTNQANFTEEWKLIFPDYLLFGFQSEKVCVK